MTYRYNQASDKTAAGADSIKAKLHDKTWEWTTKAMEDLKKIAADANKASKEVSSLEDKVELRGIEKKAHEAIAMVAKVFGKSV